MTIQKVSQASPYVRGKIGSLKKASYMLLRQFQFPNEYDDELDKITGLVHSTECYKWYYRHTITCFLTHTGHGDGSFESWITSASNEKILSFLKDIMRKENLDVKWNGYRVLGSVTGDGGFPIYSFQLFAKHPKSSTNVYTGEKAPNVAKWDIWEHRICWD